MSEHFVLAGFYYVPLVCLVYALLVRLDLIQRSPVQSRVLVQVTPNNNLCLASGTQLLPCAHRYQIFLGKVYALVPLLPFLRFNIFNMPKELFGCPFVIKYTCYLLLQHLLRVVMLPQLSRFLLVKWVLVSLLLNFQLFGVGEVLLWKSACEDASQLLCETSNLQIEEVITEFWSFILGLKHNLPRAVVTASDLFKSF